MVNLTLGAVRRVGGVQFGGKIGGMMTSMWGFFMGKYML